MANVADIIVEKADLLPFPSLDRSMTLSSTTLNKWFKPLIANVFKDFVGFRPNWDLTTGRYTISAFFDQKEFGEDEIVAFRYNAVGKNKASGINRIERFNNLVTQGNFFTLTDDAKNGFKRFMAREAKDKDGSVRWDNLDVVSQLADSQTIYNTGGKTYNVINFIEPIYLLETLFGTDAKIFVEDESSETPTTEYHKVKYVIQVMGPKPTSQNAAILQQTQFSNQPKKILNIPVILKVVQIDGKTMETVASDVGIEYRNSLGIDE